MTHVNLYNAEGYFDPTVYAALTHIEQEAKRTAYKPLVSLCREYPAQYRAGAGILPVCGIKELYPHCAASFVPSIHGGGRPGPAGAWHLFRTGLAEQVQGGVGIRAEHFKGDGRGD